VLYVHVKSIKLINFRNYKKLEIELNSKLNIFFGNNAQGKTNLLESIYIGSTGKSYRTNKDKELISLDKEQSYIGIKVQKKYSDKLIEIKMEKEKPKRVKINKVEMERVSELLGELNVVIFSPEDLKLVKEGPSERRNFLDNEISQIRPKYRYNLNRYNKILIQRNSLLKRIQIDKSKMKVLDVWDTQLASIGTEIILSRMEFLDKLSYISMDIHSKITGNLEELQLHYVSSIGIENNNRDNIKNRFAEVLKDNANKDVEKGTTEFGPHRDDIAILINDIDARVFGSQGQQRTAALSLKLAEVELINNEVGEYPVLLLDDVLSELDYNRRKYLISTFKNIQTIITSTEDIYVDEIEAIDKSKFYIKEGRVD